MPIPFIQTINGFDLMLIGFLAIALFLMWTTAVQSDEWRATAYDLETQVSTAVEQNVELVNRNNELFVQCADACQQLYELEERFSLVDRFLDSKCFCLKSRPEVRCPFHDFVEQERIRQIDPWSAPARKATSADLARWQAVTEDMGFCSCCDAGVSPADSFVTIDGRLICQGCRWEQLV